MKGVLWLVRHAETTAQSGIAVGSSDPPLSPRGIAESNALARRLAARPLSRVISSDSRRAMQTASAIARVHGLAVESCPGLRELDFGDWEGRTLADLWPEDPAAAAAWEADIRDTPVTFGETLADLERRVDEFWAGFQNQIVSGEVAIVAHRGSLSVLISIVSGDPLAEVLMRPFPMGTAIGI